MTLMAAHEEELLERFVAGDPAAFVRFYRKHLAAILAFFLRRTGDPELTADLTAEVFSAALLAAPRYQPGDLPALAWLYGIASHKLADSRRRGRVEDEARRRLALEPLGIASEMSCSELVVRQRVSRGLKSLRSQIKESR